MRVAIDFHRVPEHQLAAHKRLENWARYVRVHQPAWMAPIWRLGKSHGRQWHQPEIRETVDTLDGLAVERAVRQMPDRQRYAIRWCYVYRDTPARAMRRIGGSAALLEWLILDGRARLENRE